jgi:hypothetical protein
MYLDDILKGVEIAHRAQSRRKTQAFTASEEPIVIQALLSAADVLAQLLIEETTNATATNSQGNIRESG